MLGSKVADVSSGDAGGLDSTESMRVDPLGALDLTRMRDDVHQRLFGHAPPADTATPTPPAPPLGRGSRLGRYVILEVLGRGAMATVYAAYDPELDRNVAVKLLRPRAPSPTRSDDDGSARLMREGQALARLNHPNVVTVHDVGTSGDAIFVAMERVEGPTLRGWMQTRHRWPEVLRIMLLAGRGLAAAHAAGILHRDFKPENVMLRGDDRSDRADLVCVTDFGLARSTEHHARPAADDGPHGPRPLDLDVTATGALLGTPAYMAPEQFAGRGIDPSTDQFAFCVTTWEALFGVRPFAGDSMLTLANEVLRGAPARPPAGIDAPRWLVQALLRGLSRQQSMRWPSMDALLSALERGRTRARRRRITTATVGVLAIAGAAVGASAIDRQRRLDACEREGAAIAQVWNDDARATIRARFDELGTPLSRATAPKLEPLLDAYVEAWSQAGREVCVAAQVEHELPEPLFEAARWCLAERRAELATLVEALVDADGAAVIAAVPSAATLPPNEPCRDRAMLERMPTPDADRRDEVLAVATDLARARASRSGSLAARGEALTAVSARADALQWPPLRAAAWLATSRVLRQRNQLTEGERLAEDAFHEAARFGAWGLAADAAIDLSVAIGASRSLYAEGLSWSRLAETALALAPARDDVRDARRLSMRGRIHEANAKPKAAQDDLEQAIALTERAYGAEHPAVAEPWCRLGITYRTTANYRKMRELCGHAHEIARRTLGERHPTTAGHALNLAVAHHETGDYGPALELYQGAASVYESEYGPEHLETATAIMNLGIVAKGLGHYEQARSHYLRVLALREKVLGPDHARVAVTLRYLAELELAVGEVAAAQTHAARALAVIEKQRGSDHPDLTVYLPAVARTREAAGATADARALLERMLAITIRTEDTFGTALAHTLLGEFLRRQGDRAGARGHQLAALTIREQAAGSDDALVGQSLLRLGELDLDDGKLSEATARLERAVAIFAQALGLGQDEFDAAFALARAIVARDPARARDLAQAALAGHRAAPGDRPEQLALIAQWLREHP